MTVVLCGHTAQASDADARFRAIYTAA